MINSLKSRDTLSDKNIHTPSDCLVACSQAERTPPSGLVLCFAMPSFMSVPQVNQLSISSSFLLAVRISGTTNKEYNLLRTLDHVVADAGVASSASISRFRSGYRSGLVKTKICEPVYPWSSQGCFRWRYAPPNQTSLVVRYDWGNSSVLKRKHHLTNPATQVLRMWLGRIQPTRWCCIEQGRSSFRCCCVVRPIHPSHWSNGRRAHR